VSLEREGLRIAVEITVTTPTAHELGNVQKCLTAGFDRVILLAAERKALKRLTAALGKNLSPDDEARVHCLVVEDVPALLDELTIPQPTSATVAGYKVNVQYKKSESSQGAVQAIRDIVSRSLRRKKDG
jgi:hypothetical protein